MKQIAIGEFINLDNETYKCINSVCAGNFCDYCDFYDQDDYCYSHECYREIREDKKDVIFILYDSTEDTQID